MINTNTPKRMVRKGDHVTGMAVMGAHGTLWAGEFYTTIGEGKLTAFLSACDRSAVGYAYLILSDGSQVVASPENAYYYDR